MIKILVQNIIDGILKSVDVGNAWAANILWVNFKSLISDNWLLVSVGYSILTAIAYLDIHLGKGKLFGSFLYWTFVADIAFVAISIWGPDMFFSSLFEFVYLVIVWPLCYKLTGFALHQMKSGQLKKVWI